ncbi:hypothetical protein D3C85_1461280 [compost metagenome]
MSAQLGQPPLGLCLVVDLQRMAILGQQHRWMPGCDQFKARQGVAHQLFTVQRLTDSHLLQQPLLLVSLVEWLPQCRTANSTEQQPPSRHSVHASTQPGTSRPSFSKR